MKIAFLLFLGLMLEPAFAGEKESRLRKRTQELQKEIMARESLTQFVGKNKVTIFNWRHSQKRSRHVFAARIGDGRMPNGDLCRIKLELRQGKFGGLRTERISMVTGVCSPKNGGELYSLYSVMIKQNLIEEEHLSSLKFYAKYQRHPNLTELYALTVKDSKSGFKERLAIANGHRGEVKNLSREKSSARTEATSTRR